MSAGDRGYPLDLTSPVRHVATRLEGAGPDGPALSVRDLALTYHHPNTGDIARVEAAEGVQGERAATEWLIRTAISELGDQVTADGDGYRLATPFSELTYNGRPVHRADWDEHARLGDPFNAMTGGPFAGNVRIGKNHKRNPAEDEALRESMRANGWLAGHPAVVDERGVVITGHRRLRIAQELGIEPDIVQHEFGSGDAGDIKRLNMAWWSNEGAKSYTPEDRKAMAAYLRERGWTQESIAEALHVAQSTIARDLADRPALIMHVHNKGAEAVDSGKRQRASGGGRPRRRVEPVNPELDQEVLELIERGEPVNRAGLAAKYGLGGGGTAIKSAVDRAKGRLLERQQRAEAAAVQPPAVTLPPVQPVLDVPLPPEQPVPPPAPPQADAADIAETVERIMAAVQPLPCEGRMQLAERLLRGLSPAERAEVIASVTGS